MSKSRPAHLLFYFVLFLLPCCGLASVFIKGPLAWTAGFLYIFYDTLLLVFVIRRILRVLGQAPAAQSTCPRPTLGVLIAARNEGLVILRCLQTLMAQTDPADVIVLVDDGSTDNTVALVSAHYPQVEIRRKAHSGKADSLNAVWPNVPAEILVTLDADTLLDPHALEEFREAFSRDPDLAAAGGILTPTCLHGGWWAIPFEKFQRFEYVRAFLSRRAWMQSEALLLVSGAFGAYRKSALVEVGGYDTRSLVEDYDLIHRIHRRAFDHGVIRRVAVLASARAITDAPHGFRPFLKQRQRWFAGFLQTHFHNWDMVGNPRFGAVGRWMLPIKSLDTLQPLYGLAAFVILISLFFSEGRIPVLIVAVIAAKLVFDLAFHYWSVALYCRWQAQRPNWRLWGMAALISVAEPFSFQLLRHSGAALGWLSLLRRHHEWTPVAAPLEKPLA